MIRHLLTTAFLLSLLPQVWSQDKVTLNGYVKDADNGEELIGVTIYIPALKAGTVSNDYGFYALTIPKGKYEVRYSFIGFKEEIREIDFTSDVVQNIELSMVA